MDGAFPARGLVFLERATGQTLVGIVKEFPALITQIIAGVMFVLAVSADHHFDRFCFAPHPFAFILRSLAFHLINAELLH